VTQGSIAATIGRDSAAPATSGSFSDFLNRIAAL